MNSLIWHHTLKEMLVTPFYFVNRHNFSHHNKRGCSSSGVTPLIPVTIISQDRTTNLFLKCTVLLTATHSPAPVSPSPMKG